MLIIEVIDIINLYKNLPTIDLHGFDRDYARIKIEEFIYDNYRMKKNKVIIIHGIGSRIIEKETQKTLKNNKYVKEYKIDNFNNGQTIVELNTIN